MADAAELSSSTAPRTPVVSAAASDAATRRRNSPMLAQKRHRAELAARRAAEAAGDVDGYDARKKAAARPTSAWTLVRWAGILLLSALALSRMFTETWLFAYEGKWTRLDTYVPVRPPSWQPALTVQPKQRVFTEAELAKYDGSRPGEPIYLAIDGTVYDVTTGARTYGPGGSYSHFAGVDAARGFVTGCFAQDRTHDLRGLPDGAQKTVDGWKAFYERHKTYRRIGTVIHPPIDPLSPLPPPCDPKAA